MTNIINIDLHHGWRKFWNSMPLICPELLILITFIFAMVQENFDIHYPLMRLEWLISLTLIFTIVEENSEILWFWICLEWLTLMIWYSIPLNALRMTYIDHFNFHHGWRKFLYSIPLDKPRMTTFDDNHFRRGWGKFWYSIPLDTLHATR